MKKLSLVLLVLFAVFAVAACDSSDDSNPSPDTGEQGEDVTVVADVDEPGPDVVTDVAEPIPNPYPETRLDPICVGEVCAAGPDHAPDPGSMGPFPVAAKTVWLEDTEHLVANPFIECYEPGCNPPQPRMLRVEIWYPTTEEYRDGPFVEYDLVTDAPDSLKELIGSVDLDGLDAQAVRDAPLRTEDGPYPLVLFSHGAFGVRFQNVFQCIPLASHGYIVVSPDHQFNTTWEYLEYGFNASAAAALALPRIDDSRFLIDTLTEWAENIESMWYQQVATERIGVTGHSFGGFVSLVLGGIDERIDAVIPLSPAGRAVALWPTVDIPNFPVPCFIMGGDADNTLEFEPEMLDIYDRIIDEKAFLRIFRGGHYTFSDMCTMDVIALAEDLGWEDAEQSLNDGCGEENYDPVEARAMISYYTNAWFNHFLRQSPGSWDYINADRIEGFEDDVEFMMEFSE